MKKIKNLIVGIINKDAYKKRTIAIAKGEYTPKKDDPKVWFDSIESFARVLSEENRDLLSIIAEKKPSSIVELASLVGRKPPSVHRTLKTMNKYGLVKLAKEKNRVIPRAEHHNVQLSVSF